MTAVGAGSLGSAPLAVPARKRMPTTDIVSDGAYLSIIDVPAMSWIAAMTSTLEASRG
jgi:hypothetical protein